MGQELESFVEDFNRSQILEEGQKLLKRGQSAWTYSMNRDLIGRGHPHNLLSNHYKSRICGLNQGLTQQIWNSH